jgi:hypothetical protein
MLERANNALLGWCRSSRWEDSWDRMRIAHHLALTLKICTQSFFFFFKSTIYILVHEHSLVST